MKQESYWLESAPAFTGGAAGNAEGKVDVAIVGGGFTGLSSALAITRRGGSVALFEAKRVSGEASGRNGGHCSNGTAQSYSALVKSHGEEKARRFFQAYNDAVDSVERLAKEHAIDCDFERCGKIKLAAKPGHLVGLQSACKALRESGLDPDAEVISAEDLGREINTPGFYGGLLQPRAAKLHVGRFGVGLAEAAARAGAAIYENAPVTGLRKVANGWCVSSPRGEVVARQVLVATGGSGAGPFGWFRRRIVPVGSFAVATEPLPQALVDEVFPGGRNYVTSRHIGNYFRLTQDNRLLFGGRARFAVSNPKSDEQSGDILRRSLDAMFPRLAGVKIDYCWGGSVDMSADRLPRAGEQQRDLYYAMGYSGHGVQMAAHMGEIMAEVMAGNTEANPWRGLSWPAIPGHFGKPWFLPFVGAYYRALDYLQ